MHAIVIFRIKCIGTIMHEDVGGIDIFIDCITTRKFHLAKEKRSDVVVY